MPFTTDLNTPVIDADDEHVDIMYDSIIAYGPIDKARLLSIMDQNGLTGIDMARILDVSLRQFLDTLFGRAPIPEQLYAAQIAREGVLMECTVEMLVEEIKCTRTKAPLYSTRKALHADHPRLPAWVSAGWWNRAASRANAMIPFPA